MKVCIFGGWPNAKWLGLLRELERLGNEVIHYASTAEQCDTRAFSMEDPVVAYSGFSSLEQRARRALVDADAAVVLSDSPDALEASALVLSSNVPRRVFFDRDTPQTVSRMSRGESIPWIGDAGLEGFDLILTSTGGSAPDVLRESLGARRVVPFAAWVDTRLLTEAAQATEPTETYRCALSCAPHAPSAELDAPTAEALEQLFLQPARVRRRDRFLLTGAPLPADTRMPRNLEQLGELSDEAHSELIASSRLTLHLAASGPEALLETVARGGAVLAESFEGLGELLEPGEEVLVAADGVDVLAALSLDETFLTQMAESARARLYAQHTVHHRARQLTALLERGTGLYLVGAEASG